MANIYKQLWGFSRTQQRRNVALLVAALLLSLIASATHIHTDEDQDALGERTVVCSVCLSLPVGATPPAACTVIVAVRFAHVLIVPTVAPAPRAVVLSSYLSRAPPAL